MTETAPTALLHEQPAAPAHVEDQSVSRAKALSKVVLRPSHKKVGWRVKQWAYEAGVSNSSTWELIASRRIKSVKFGSARIITTSPGEFLSSLEQD